MEITLVLIRNSCWNVQLYVRALCAAAACEQLD